MWMVLLHQGDVVLLLLLRVACRLRLAGVKVENLCEDEAHTSSHLILKSHRRLTGMTVQVTELLPHRQEQNLHAGSNMEAV